MKRLESTFPNMVVVLTLITVIAASGLGAMHMVTEEPIAAAKQAKQEAAIREVLPPYDHVDTAIVVNEQKVFRAFDADGKIVGLAIESWAVGFGGNIKVMVGIDNTGKIVNYSLLEHAETPGLGSKLTDWFKVRSDIRNTSIANRPLTVSKDGGEFDAITAATISSRAFLNAINKAAETYMMCFDNAMSAHPDAFSEATTLLERRLRQKQSDSPQTENMTDETTSADTAQTGSRQTEATGVPATDSINAVNPTIQ